ncbi:NADPH:quinone reductase or related Zn-dependent oxidoreductase [Mycobacterium numidiamassiliense]|uniref:NADPH:quinone reductase or related Zn-dependent oxidoreductase n=1 Tax=Mycobacterium numidiamassiliense TaxID=1841861 RepID=A0A2U3P5R2_9MYCO|nr:zinc-binding dehydrogenase [Mycobacterium numidiamassiliense]SPM39091.1 NADPH:quinone reductase or related Zn-dependent oxidoreductase [Mycobacterium numidiamassiliense]
MKAVSYDRFGGPEVLHYLDLPDPTPGAGQLLIQTIAVGVNFPDIRERLGVYNKAETRVGGVQLPQVGGLAVAGTVVATGPQTSVPVGSRVVALMKKGAYAQVAVAEEPLCAVVDEDADLRVLAGFAAQAACAHLLLQASTTLRTGESLLVHGAAGGVGGLAVQIAKVLGAKPIIGTASTSERREFVRALGADAAISYDEPGWTDQVLELTSGRGVDVLIESIGGEVFEQNFDALAPFGRYLLLGSSRGPGEPFAPRRLMTKSQALIGFYLPVFYDRPELIGNALRFLTDGLKTGQITSQVDEVLPLNQAAEAHRRLEGREVRGVIVLDPTIES